MNERIRQLAEQAGLNYHNWITNESNVSDGNFKYPRLEDYEKFAELIVRECAGLMDGRRVEYGNCKDGRVILKHFGVEE